MSAYYNQLHSHLQEECNRHGIKFDEDDTEFVLDIVIGFLRRNRMEITGAGVQRALPKI